MRCAILVTAGGRGERFARDASGLPKQFQPLGGEPLMLHALRALEDHGLPFVERIVTLPPLVGDPELESEWNRISGRCANPWTAVTGGASRADSVYAGLLALEGLEIDLVAIHDAARPFPPVEATCRAIGLLERDTTLDAAIVAAPMTDTVKTIRGDGHEIAGTLDRNTLARAETPQVARFDALLAALAHANRPSITDEAQAIELAGGRARAVIHQGWNPKITRALDLAIAAATLAATKGDRA